MKLNYFAATMICAIGFVSLTGTAIAQPYPTTSIRLIVPYPPSGGADTAGRIIAEALTESLREQVIVDNRPGASGRIGTVLAAKAPADGYTLLLGNVGPNAIIPASYKKLPYDQMKDFSPISLVASTDYMLVVHPSLPVRTLKDLIVLAKKSPDKINFASTGNLGGPHLAGELLKVMANINMVHVPYKGGGAAVTGILAGEVELIFGSSPTVVPHVKVGRLRAVVTTGLKRTDVLTGVPTIAETLPGYEITQWYGVLAPAGTPKDILSRLHSEIVKATKQKKVIQQFEKVGADAMSSKSPEHFAEHIKREMDKWGDVVRKSGIPLE